MTVKPASGTDTHRPAPAAEELEAALCLKERRSVGNDGCVCLRGRWFQLLGSDNAPRWLKHVEVREHLDGRVELWTQAGERRKLIHQDLPERPTRAEQDKPSLAERVAPHAEPHKRQADHPWK